MTACTPLLPLIAVMFVTETPTQRPSALVMTAVVAGYSPGLVAVRHNSGVQALPWMLDVGYSVMCVALMLAMMGHVLFGVFEVTMTTLPDSISGEHTHDLLTSYRPTVGMAGPCMPCSFNVLQDLWQ